MLFQVINDFLARIQVEVEIRQTERQDDAELHQADIPYPQPHI